MRYCAEVRYFLSNDMYQEFTMFEPFVMAVAKEYDLNIDGIADYCTENHIYFPRKMIEIIDYLYKKSNIYNKTKFFYQTIHESKYMFDHIIHEIDKVLQEYIFSNTRLDTTNNYQNISDTGITDILNSMETIFEVKNRNITVNTDHNLLFDFYLNFEDCYKKIYDKLSQHIYFTFDEINNNEYIKRKLTSGEIFVYNVQNNNGGTDTVYYNTRNNSHVNIQRTVDTGSRFGNAMHDLNSNYISSTTTTTSNRNINSMIQTTHNTHNTYNTYNTFDSLLDEWPSSKIKLPKVKVPKKSKTKEYSVFKKSLKGITKFISYDDINMILSDGLIISGKKFNFRIKANKRDLLRYSKTLDNFSISYELELLDKENNKLCKICIVYKDCPILDEILTVYLSIKTGNEDKIIEIGNHFNTTSLYEVYFPKENPSTIIERIRTNSRTDRKMHVLDIIRRWVRGRFTNILPIDTINYIFEAFVSWDEALDYAGVGITNTIFDNMVKRVKWEEIKKEVNLIKMDNILPEFKNITTEDLIKESKCLKLITHV